MANNTMKTATATANTETKAPRITKRDNFLALLTVVQNANPENADALTAFINNEIALLDKRKTTTKPTKTQTANETLKADILTALAEIGTPVTISEMQARVPALAEFSNQKLSAVIKLMIDNDKTVCKTVDKKKSLFSVA